VTLVQALEPLTTTVGAVFAVWLGLLWGSFANVCIYRWPPTDEHPTGRSVVAPGSHCSACKTPIRWYDNVPILSYLWLRGKCRSCGAAFSPRYLLVELVTGALFGVAWWFTLGTGGMLMPLKDRGLHFVVYAAFVFAMVVITFIDIDHKKILNKVTRPAIVLGYGASLLLGRMWWEGLLGIAIGYGVPWLIGELYYRLRGFEGMGLGDAMLLAVIGSVFGWRGVAFALFGGSLLGSVVHLFVFLRARKSVLRSELPFGPYLAAASTFYLFAEPWIRLQSRLL
jgi:leader peptidase (prepilin peptidase)/N-methyltransferase